MRRDFSKKTAIVTPKSGPNVVVIGAIVAALLVVAVVVAIVIGNYSKSGASSTAQSVPAGVTGGTNGGIVANPSTPKGNAPTLDIYEDFQCPRCAELEKAIGAKLATLTEAGDVTLVVHTLSFLDDYLKNNASGRAANAVACAADADKFLEYHAAVFAAQPVKEGDGYTDAQLTQSATTAGITGTALAAWQKCTTSGAHNQYVADGQTASGKAGVNSTPTVKLNGKDIIRTLPFPFGPATAQSLAVLIKAATK